MSKLVAFGVLFGAVAEGEESALQVALLLACSLLHLAYVTCVRPTAGQTDNAVLRVQGVLECGTFACGVALLAGAPVTATGVAMMAIDNAAFMLNTLVTLASVRSRVVEWYESRRGEGGGDDEQAAEEDVEMELLKVASGFLPSSVSLPVERGHPLGVMIERSLSSK